MWKIVNDIPNIETQLKFQGVRSIKKVTTQHTISTHVNTYFVDVASICEYCGLRGFFSQEDCEDNND